MPEKCRNIYKRARKESGFTQEYAAEKLGISVESLRAYETGQRVPPDEVVADMFDLYNTLHLIVQHVRKKNAMYGRVVPDVPQIGALEASAKLRNRLDSFAERRGARRLMLITEDNVIDDSERPEFDEIVDELVEMFALVLALISAKPEPAGIKKSAPRCARPEDGRGRFN